MYEVISACTANESISAVVANEGIAAGTCSKFIIVKAADNPDGSVGLSAFDNNTLVDVAGVNNSGSGSKAGCNKLLFLEAAIKNNGIGIVRVFSSPTVAIVTVNAGSSVGNGSVALGNADKFILSVLYSDNAIAGSLYNNVLAGNSSLVDKSVSEYDNVLTVVVVSVVGDNVFALGMDKVVITGSTSEGIFAVRAVERIILAGSADDEVVGIGTDN